MYIHTRVTQKEKIREVIRQTFEDDEKLFEKYHFINGDIEVALLDTFSKIEDLIKNYGAEFYKIEKGGQLIGYINVAPSARVFHSFGLKKDFRTSDDKKYLLDLVDSFFGDEMFYCTLFSKNTRGVDFLKSNGFVDEGLTVLIKNKK